MWVNAWLIWEKRDLLRSLPSISIPWCLRVWALLGGSKGIWGGSKGIWEVVVDASSCPQLDPAAFGSVCRHRAHPRMPPLPLGEAAGQRLPVIDVLWVITADNEIFNHHLYYGGSAEPGGKPLLFGQGCADGFGAILVLAEPGGPCVLANGLRLWWWQPLCVPELSLASAGHCWGSQQGREGTDPAGGHGLPLVPCPHCHQQCRLALFGTQGFAWGPFGELGGGLWVFSHSFVSLPVPWLREAAAGSWILLQAAGTLGCNAMSILSAAPPSWPQVQGDFSSSILFMETGSISWWICMPPPTMQPSPTGTHPAASLSPSTCPALYPTHSQGFSAVNLSTAGLRTK